MKYKMEDIADVTLINKQTGENTLLMNTLSTSEIISNKNSAPLPRVFRLKNIEVNRDLFEKSLPHIGRTLRVESDIANGLFTLSLENNEIVFSEAL